jgi:hypothetical protein
MELDNEDVLLGMTIAAIILGIGGSLFFINPYTGYGAVVLAIGMMTLALMITARPRVIERVRREIVLQPTKQAEPTPITPPTFVIPTAEPPKQVSPEARNEQATPTTTSENSHTEEATPAQEIKSEETQTAESTQSKPEKKEEEPITATPS